ncbi:hypothetical protein [Sinorhizobium americanum]|uniref:Uncharacterized protein n=1 Tax=Sinorhizobium americanum TaxID=194963 RepID=A0A1L3LM52_9HYPH|nr:hypothetical protein [Sinorhizobium americanum]APG91161.1 hypothetical protein SAMCFNEI73_Ch1872 [Sinorhizobium americanum]OAP43738.1 hypothetical protein ATC00_02540 [Sinorhizobium americanum]
MAAAVVRTRYILNGLDLANSTSLYSQIAFDPIFTPIFTSFFASLGFSATTASILGSVTTAIATTAISIGLQAAMAPKPPKPEDGKVPITQSVPYRHWVVGRTRVAGAYMLWEAKGGGLFSVQAIAGHKIKAINRYYLHDDEVTVGAGNYVNGLPGGRYGDQKVQVFHRLGLSPETAYSEIVTYLGSEGIWTNNHRGDGQASLAMIARTPSQKDFNKRFPYNAPRMSAEVDGAYVFDYRISSDPENASAWVWSRNSALIMCWHQCFNEFGHRRDFNRAILPVLDMWIEEANICDEDVALAAGGTEKRYETNGWDTTENGPKAATNAILASCDGWICERGDGALLFTVGKFRESRVATLTDADLVGHQIQYDVLFEDEVNKLIPKFTYPAIDYATSDTDSFEDVDAQLVAGRVLAQEADYSWCHQWRQARRLGIRDWRRLQQKVSGSLDVRLSGINAVYSRWVRLQTPFSIPRLDGKLIENRKSILALMSGGFSMDIMLHPDNIDDWNPAVDEGQQPPVPIKPAVSDIPVPVVNTVQAVPSSGSVSLRIVIVDPDDDGLTPTVRYRVSDTGSGSPGPWVEQQIPDAEPAGGFVTLDTNTVPNDRDLDVQVAFITSKGTYGNWSITEEVFSAADQTAPAALATFTLSGSAPRLGNAVFGFSTGNDSHVRTVNIYRVATGAAFDPDTATLVGTRAVAPSASYSFTDGDATRTNLLSNPGFDSDTVWTKGTGWTISGGKAHKAAGTAAVISQAAATANGKKARIKFDVSSYSAGEIRARISTAGTVFNDSPDRTGNGTFLESITATAARDTVAFRASSTFVGSIDDVVMFEETASCAPQGVWDYYALPVNGSGVEGPHSGPLAVTIV